MQNSTLILLVCAGLLLSGGAILGGSAGWSILRMSYYFWTSDLGMELGAGIQLVAGGILCLPACWLATLMTSKPRTTALPATLMFLTTAAMVVLCTGLISLGSLSNAIRDTSQLNASFHRAMARENCDYSVRNALAAMQIELRCCGIQSPSDWFKHRAALPAACCNRWMPGKVKNISLDVCEFPVFTSGCLRSAALELRAYVNAMAILTCVIIITLAVTLFATAYTLVTGVVERGEPGAQKPDMQSTRAPYPQAPPKLPLAPLVTLVPPFM
ncbi:tetraspanin family domain-containing protein [Phthorimaea operculella]|nr:tetraspanin family domain-containing protein [Phthorimaea operculella]